MMSSFTVAFLLSSTNKSGLITYGTTLLMGYSVETKNNPTTRHTFTEQCVFN